MYKAFNNIEGKNLCVFIMLDKVNFYPSISSKLVSEALQFASSFDTITNDEKHIIISAKNSVLFNNNHPWWKKSSKSLFAVTMGSYDGAESCKLVGIYLLHEITSKHGNNFGLYRDDGIGILGSTPRRIECLKKDICALFKEHDLHITIQVNTKVVNFLDITCTTVSTSLTVNPAPHYIQFRHEYSKEQQGQTKYHLIRQHGSTWQRCYSFP